MSITEKCLRSLPLGKFIKFDEICDLEGRKRKVVVWLWEDRLFGSSLSNFDVETGQYLGENWIP